SGRDSGRADGKKAESIGSTPPNACGDQLGKCVRLFDAKISVKEHRCQIRTLPAAGLYSPVAFGNKSHIEYLCGLPHSLLDPGALLVLVHYRPNSAAFSLAVGRWAARLGTCRVGSKPKA